MNVLIVDDEPMTRSLLRRVLSREFGCTVLEATNGLEALSVAGSKPVDLIVTDLRMPVMDGIELLEALRQFPPLAAIPVVMMSAAREPGPVHRAIELGVTDYLLKPLEAARVAARLRAVVERIAQLSMKAKVETTGRVEVDATTPILVADGNADFRHFFSSTMAGRTIYEAETGVAALQRCVESKPGIVFVGGELGVLGPELLVRKLRATPELASTRIFAILPKQALDQGTAPAKVDGVATRTFVADDFRKQVDRLIGIGAKLGGVLVAHPTLRVQMASAAEQVFGMMLQLEVAPTFELETLPVAHVVTALIRFSLPDAGGESLTLALRTDRESARLVASGLHAAAVAKAEAGAGAAPPPAADDVMGAVAEVVNIIGGRLRTALEDAGVRATMGLPEQSEGGAANLSDGGTQGVQVTVKTVEKGLAFVLHLTSSLRAVDAAPPQAAPEPASAS
jgi:CheY-like chemotaxis protein